MSGVGTKEIIVVRNARIASRGWGDYSLDLHFTDSGLFASATEKTSNFEWLQRRINELNTSYSALISLDVWPHRLTIRLLTGENHWWNRFARYDIALAEEQSKELQSVASTITGLSTKLHLH